MRNRVRLDSAGKEVPMDRGIRDLVEVVRARESALKEVVGDSGTATRMSMQSLLSSPVKTIAEGVLGRGAALAYLGATKTGLGQRVARAGGAAFERRMAKQMRERQLKAQQAAQQFDILSKAPGQ